MPFVRTLVAIVRAFTRIPCEGDEEKTAASSGNLETVDRIEWSPTNRERNLSRASRHA